MTKDAQFLEAHKPRLIPEAAAGFKYPIRPPHGRTLVRVIAVRNFADPY